VHGRERRGLHGRELDVVGARVRPLRREPEGDERQLVPRPHRAGIFIGPIGQRYKVGDELLAQLYDGTITQGASRPTCGDTSNPTPNDTAASCTQTWSGITTTNAPKGIYVVFEKGISSAPYTGREQVKMTTANIADQKKQFYIDTSDTYANVASVGTSATYTVRVTDGTGQNQWSSPSSSYPIALAIEQCPKNGSTTLTRFLGSASPGTQTE